MRLVAGGVAGAASVAACGGGGGCLLLPDAVADSVVVSVATVDYQTGAETIGGGGVGCFALGGGGGLFHFDSLSAVDGAVVGMM